MRAPTSPEIDTLHSCPACGSELVYVFYTIEHVPVSSVTLLRSRQQAQNIPRGKIDLTHCRTCGFIFNRSFVPRLVYYTPEYESTQIFSPAFNSFSHRLARQLIDTYNLHGRTIIEIGCGQGEFLSLLCKEGRNRGIGFDPAYNPERSAVPDHTNVTIIPENYPVKQERYRSDFICCRMTLEHIRDVSGFISTIRRSMGNRQDTVVFFQVPDVSRILMDAAFWDIYYEHCSYFTKDSLVRLIQQQGFEIVDLWNDFGNQYLMITAHLADFQESRTYVCKDVCEGDTEATEQFSKNVPVLIARWKQIIEDGIEMGQRIVLWGSGSKAVAFLTTLGLIDEIEYTVDINPYKHGTFMAGTCQEVVSPEFLEIYKPDLIVLMNPIYVNEVKAEIVKRGLSSEIIALGG